MNFKQFVLHNAINVPGRYSRRKIVVIESDDWGSIRMPSKEVYKKLLKSGYVVDQRIFEKYDSLEGQDDLELLFEVLAKHKDGNGKAAVITANAVSANPDFDKIKGSDFQQYYYEPFTETLQKTPGCSAVFKLWEEGYNSGIFIPQFHGREHINVAAWMKALQNKDADTRMAFEYGMNGIFPRLRPEEGNQFMVALNPTNQDELSATNRILEDGIRLFHSIHGFRPLSFIAPCYTWHPSNEKILSENGIASIQGGYIQSVPSVSPETSRKYLHYIGQRNNLGQYYSIRNCTFEPVTGIAQAVEKCLSQMTLAFRWGKPAIICSHRINYIGRIHPENRDRNLKAFDALLGQIVRLWPDVEFVSSPDLFQTIINEAR
jgi:hypothetical protein